jgi:hypothetical protein
VSISATRLHSELRNGIAEHRWEVAGAAAYPSLLAVDEDIIGRPATADELCANRDCRLKA